MNLEHRTDAGLPLGSVLLAVADGGRPVHGRSSDDRSNDLALLAEARSMVIQELGEDAMIEAAATVAAFNGLVRVADGTGIQLDPGLEKVSAPLRSALGIDNYAGSASTPTPSTLTSGTPLSDDDTSRQLDTATRAMDLFR